MMKIGKSAWTLLDDKRDWDFFSSKSGFQAAEPPQEFPCLVRIISGFMCDNAQVVFVYPLEAQLLDAAAQNARKEQNAVPCP